MIQSMTGFGQAAVDQLGGLRILTEMKSLNHRYNDIVVRLPQDWVRLEYEIRKMLQSRFKRGRIDVYVTIERDEQSGKKAAINWPVAESYRACAKLLSQQWGLKEIETKDALDWVTLPDFITFSDELSLQEDEVVAAILASVDQAADQLLDMRRKEGRHLAANLREHLRRLVKFQEEMLKLAPLVAAKNRQKLRERLIEVLEEASQIDESRFVMEIALQAERTAIDEELDRLRSHLMQCSQLLEADEPVGRKLDFLTQEMNREANTIGSKSGHPELINIAVECKVEIEKIREQVQNIQ